MTQNEVKEEFEPYIDELRRAAEAEQDQYAKQELLDATAPIVTMVHEIIDAITENQPVQARLRYVRELIKYNKIKL